MATMTVNDTLYLTDCTKPDGNRLSYLSFLIIVSIRKLRHKPSVFISHFFTLAACVRCLSKTIPESVNKAQIDTVAQTQVLEDSFIYFIGLCCYKEEYFISTTATSIMLGRGGNARPSLNHEGRERIYWTWTQPYTTRDTHGPFMMSCCQPSSHRDQF